MALTFITGPVRSGKSRFALHLAESSGKRVTFVATAALYPDDAEWSERIARHRRERPAAWPTVECEGEVGRALAELPAAYGEGDLLLVDSLGTWLAAEMQRSSGDALAECCRALVAAFAAARCSAIVVSEETGWGIVPEYASARTFRDALGRLNAEFARVADAAYLAVSGYALDLKRGMPIPQHVE